MNTNGSDYVSLPVDTTTTAQAGSLQRGLSGDYQLVVGDVIKEAWARASGNKGKVWIAVLMYMAVLFCISFVFTLLFGPPPAPVEGAIATASPVDMVQQAPRAPRF